MGKHTKFAIRLRELREEAGVSMLQLAKAIGVSDAAVCKWENGLAEPKASYLVRLAEYFDCTADYLLGKDGEYYPHRAKVTVYDGTRREVKPPSAAMPDAATVATDIELSPKEAKLVKSFRELSPEMKDFLQSALKLKSDDKT
ncbi:MAG: helix-turn-helix domain-containing protein [Roseburia sp.]|nr:helix-turn-helix domain-containing protein [Roseburia sp.]